MALRSLLIQMPFHTLDMPSISLALLKASLERAGHVCDVRYCNVEFGRRIGQDVYSWIAGAFPPYLLFGDLVFSPSLHGTTIGQDRLEELVGTLDHRVEPVVPWPVIDEFPRLTKAANEFLHEVLKHTDWSRYDLVGFATMFQVTPSLAMARLIKSSDNAPRVILGGSNCEGDMGEYLHRQFPFIDFVCPGEGERLIVELAATMQAGAESYAQIPGLIWREEGTTKRNKGRAHESLIEAGRRRRREREHSLDWLPRPRYDDWLEQIANGRPPRLRSLRLPIETSRGCWWGEKRHCIFCGLNGSSMAFRSKSPQRALEEFRELRGYGIGMIQSVDNVLDFRYFDSLLPELAREPPTCDVFFEVRSNLSRERLALLRQCGVFWSQPGIESLSTSVLKLMGKGVTALQNVRFLKHTAELGIGVGWVLLFGFPGEDPQEYRKMAELMPAISHLQPPTFTCLSVKLHRFSPLFEKREEYRLLQVEPAAAYAEIYPFARHEVEQLAYYFRHQYASHPDPDSYIGDCDEAVRWWHGEVGKAAFICFASGKGLHLVDTRADSSPRHALLVGREREVFEACADGATLDKLCRCVALADRKIASLVETFLERRWAVELDGRILALAVPMPVPPYLPAALVKESLVQSYCERITRLQRGFLHPPMSE